MNDQRRCIAIVKIEINRVFKRTLRYQETSIRQASRLTPIRMNKTYKVSVIVKLAFKSNV